MSNEKFFAATLNFLLFLLVFLLFAVVAFYINEGDLKSQIISPIDKKISSLLCSKEPKITNWSKCIDFKQERINYYCNFSSHYKWKSFTEKKACIPPQQKEQYILRKYNWTFKGKKYYWEYVFPKSLYEYYKSRERANTQDYTIYATDPKDDKLISDLINHLKNYSQQQGFKKYEFVNFIISFVQGLPYTSDNVTTPYDEYPRYPIETLVDDGGDCEDSSILAAVLLNELNYSVVLLEFSDHMAVGVSCEKDVGVHYTDKYNNTFCYLETTGANWKIGMIPDKYKNETPKIYYVIPKPLLEINWNSTGKATLFSAVYDINIIIKNEGSATAKNITVWAGFDTINKNKVYAQKQIGPYILKPDTQLNKTISLKIKRGKYTRLHIIVSGKNFKPQELFSKWLTT